MKLVKLLFAATVMSTFFLSCNKGDECDGGCDPINPEVKFMIVNSANKNLMCGPDKAYYLKQIEVKSLVGGTLTNSAVYFDGVDSTTAQTGLAFIASLNDKYYLYVDGIVTDSMEIAYRFGNPARKNCCPLYNSITSLKLNTVTTSYVYPDNTSSVTIVK